MTNTSVRKQEIVTRITTAIRDGTTVVFPSEIIAQHWRHRALYTHCVPALWSDTILAWDRFKCSHLHPASSATAATNRARILFTASLDRSDARLRALYAQFNSNIENSPMVIRKMIALLPKIEYMLTHNIVSAGKPLHDALTHVHHAYQKYLSRHNLYESLSVTANGMHHASILICFPELIDEIPLLADTAGITQDCVMSTPAEYAPVHMREYDIITDEITDVAVRIRGLLQNGVDCTDIAVTAARLEEVQDMVESIFGLYQIPFSVHKSKPLIQYTFGEMLTLFNRAGMYDFSYDILLELASHPQIIWNAHAAEMLNSERIRKNQHLYRAFPYILYQAIRGILRAPSMQELHTALTQFMYTHIDIEKWSAVQSQSFEYAIRILRACVEEADIGENIGNPFSLYLLVLQCTNYSPTAPLSKVAIYDYPVSVGIYPQHHFLINMMQSAVSNSYNNWSMFSAQFKTRHDLTDDNTTIRTLQLYSHSGEHVYCSYSAHTYAKSSPPAMLFFEQNTPPTKHLPAHTADDPLHAEEQLFFENDTPHTPKLECVLPMQQTGSKNYMRHHTPTTGQRFNVAPINNPAIVQMIQESLCSEENDMRISHAMLQSYIMCPYRFYLERVLRLVEYDYQYEDERALRTGSVQHVIMSAIFKEVQQHNATLQDAGRIIHVENIIDETLAIKKEMFSELEQSSLLLSIREQCVQAWHAIAEYYPSYTVYAVEELYDARDTELYTLNGKIDLLLHNQQDNYYVLVDYKRSIQQKKGDDITLSKDMQLAFYSEILATHDIRCYQAQYYIFKKGAFQDRRPETAAADEIIFASIREAIRTHTSELVQKIAQGDFSLPNTDGHCKKCAYPEQCRSAFSL